MERKIKDTSQFTMSRWEVGFQEYYLDRTLIALILVIFLNHFCDQGVYLDYSEVPSPSALVLVLGAYDVTAICAG